MTKWFNIKRNKNMKITIEQDSLTVTVEYNVAAAYSVINDLIIPSLLASGFHRDSIMNAMGSIASENEDE